MLYTIFLNGAHWSRSWKETTTDQLCGSKWSMHRSIHTAYRWEINWSHGQIKICLKMFCAACGFEGRSLSQAARVQEREVVVIACRVCFTIINSSCCSKCCWEGRKEGFREGECVVYEVYTCTCMHIYMHVTKLVLLELLNIKCADNPDQDAIK